MRAPAALHARAIESVCSRLSTVQGPAITTGRSPPTVTPPAITGRVLNGATYSGCEERVTRSGGRAGIIAVISSTANQMSVAVASNLKCNKPIALSVEGEESRRSPDALRRREGATGSLRTPSPERIEQELRRVVGDGRRPGGGRPGGPAGSPIRTRPPPRPRRTRRRGQIPPRHRSPPRPRRPARRAA